MTINKSIAYLKKLRVSAIPQATRSTLNSLAFQGRKEAQKNIDRKFINRNAYTKRGVLVTRATQRDIRAMRSTVGHSAEYMKYQEQGGSRKASGKYKWIPLPGSRVGRLWNKLPRRNFHKGKLEITGGAYSRSIKSRKARSTAEMFMAKKTGKLIKRGSFLFMVKSIKRTGGNAISARLLAIHKLEDSSYNIKAQPWLRPAVRKVTALANVERTFNAEALRILNKR